MENTYGQEVAYMKQKDSLLHDFFYVCSILQVCMLYIFHLPLMSKNFELMRQSNNFDCISSSISKYWAR